VAADGAACSGAGEIAVRPAAAGPADRRPRRPSLVGVLALGTIASASLLWVTQLTDTPPTTVVTIAPVPSPGPAPTGRVGLPVERTDDVLAGLVARARSGLRVEAEGSTRTADGQVGDVVVRGGDGPRLVRASLRRVPAGSLTCANSDAGARRCRTAASGTRVVVERGTPAREAAWTSVEVTRASGLQVTVRGYAGPDPREPGRGRPPLSVAELETIAAAPQWR
jgi:hypothetical protein